MGVFADLLASPKTIDTGGADGVRVAGDKVTTREINTLMARMGDPDYPAAYAAKNEVQSIAIYSGLVNGGTFTLTIKLKGKPIFTTAAIAYNANAATIQTAINTAGTAAGNGWVNDSVVVTGGPLTTTPLTLTYSGASVAALNHDQATINGSLLTGGGSAGAASTTTQGQTKRTAWATLLSAGVLGGTVPVQGDTPSGLTVLNTRESYPQMISQDTIRALAEEAAFEDGNEAVKTEILRVLGIA